MGEVGAKLELLWVGPSVVGSGVGLKGVWNHVSGLCAGAWIHEKESGLGKGTL